MAVKKIITIEDETLRKVSKRIDKVDEETLALIKDLKDTLHSNNGIGLAAPQIGVLKRVIFIDLLDGSAPILLINPKIIAKCGREKDYEGCLSYPGFEGIVVRPRKVTVIGKNEKGEEVEYRAEGLLARAFCHEIDHLNGIMYVDKSKKIVKISNE